MRWFAGKEDNHGVLWDAVFEDRPAGDLVALVSRAEYAPLIAAAPAMMKVLESLVEYWHHGTPVYPGAEIVAEARAALAKAKGR